LRDLSTGTAVEAYASRLERDIVGFQTFSTVWLPHGIERTPRQGHMLQAAHTLWYLGSASMALGRVALTRSAALGRYPDDLVGFDIDVPCPSQSTCFFLPWLQYPRVPTFRPYYVHLARPRRTNVANLIVRSLDFDVHKLLQDRNIEACTYQYNRAYDH
jgi:hypothetical protein